MCGRSQIHGDLLPCCTLMWPIVWPNKTGFFNTVVSSMVSPQPLQQGVSPPELWTIPHWHPQGMSIILCQAAEGLGFTVPWGKASGSCQPKANWRSPLTVFNLLIKAVADLIVIPNSFPRLPLSPLLVWLVAMIWIYPKGFCFFLLTTLSLLGK